MMLRFVVVISWLKSLFDSFLSLTLLTIQLCHHFMHLFILHKSRRDMNTFFKHQNAQKDVFFQANKTQLKKKSHIQTIASRIYGGLHAIRLLNNLMMQKIRNSNHGMEKPNFSVGFFFIFANGTIAVGQFLEWLTIWPFANDQYGM